MRAFEVGASATHCQKVSVPIRMPLSAGSSPAELARILSRADATDSRGLAPASVCLILPASID